MEDRRTGSRSPGFLSIVHRVCAVLVLAFLTACASQKVTPQQGDQIESAVEAINAHQPQQAIEISDSILKQAPDGPAAAQAHYLKGRGYEMKTALSTDESRKNLRMARASFEDGLNHAPPPPLEGDLRASLSNVAFFLDDYPTALAESLRAYNLTDSVDVQSILLFRMAVSQQRMGRFSDADKTFALVQSRFPNSTVARRSKQMAGQRNFYVQIATYTNPAGAERDLASLQSGIGRGMALSRRTDTSGHVVLNAGPFASFDEAQQAKQKFVDDYPDALILP